MGFEFEDAQLAVQNGKLSVEEAIDWIVQGKPAAQAPAAQGAVLKLNRVSPRALIQYKDVILPV